MIDFLNRAFKPIGDVVREQNIFLSTTPWATARYRDVALKRGWWVLESDGDTDEIEFRVCDSAGQILFCRPAQAGTVNLFLARSTSADIDLMLSPWPSRTSFRRLCFRRLKSIEIASFLIRRARLFMGGDKPLARLIAAARLLTSGSNFAARDGTDTARLENLTLGVEKLDSASRLTEVVHSQGVTFVLEDDQILDARTIDLVVDTFRRNPEARAIFGDVLEDETVQPAPQWDDERAQWFKFARSPIFFRDHCECLSPSNAWTKLRDIGSKYGAKSIVRIPLPLAIAKNKSHAEALPRLPAPSRNCWPTVSVVIPTKHRTDLLAKCLKSLRGATEYPNLEVVIVDNGANGSALGDLLKIESDLQRIVKVNDGGDFNFSRLINSGVRASSGEVLLLLNDDVIAQEPGWLHRMVHSAMHAGTGAVGARLLYPSGEIQHAGVMLGLGGVCGHLWRNMPAAEAERNPHIVFPGCRMAVTAACLAVRRKAYDQVNGFDEINYPVTLNDIDFCLRLNREGLRTVYRGDAVLLHDESQSRGNDHAERRKRERRRGEATVFREMWNHLLDDDPFASPAFDLSTESGSVYIAKPR